MDINIRPMTPQDLEQAGYRIECGSADNAVDVAAGIVGKYWWTQDGLGLSSLTEWDSADEAADAARQHQQEIEA